MTNTKPLPMLASVVTPRKMETDRKVQARLLNRALGLAPSNMHTGMRTHQGPAQPKSSTTRENQQQSSPSRSKARVFRCLSNTTSSHHHSGSMQSPPRSPSSSSRSRSAQAAQRSALQSMFQPPASSPSRHMKRSPEVRTAAHTNATLPAMAFFGSRLDRSSLSCRPLRSSTPAEITNDDGKKVHFRPTVEVLRIPSHKLYPSAVKKTLWGGMKEIKANAIRNTAEYIFDKCNWRKSTEEDQFYRDTRNGNLIHPVHVQRYYAAMKRQKEEQAKKQQEQEESENQGEQQQEEPAQKQEERINRKRSVRCCSPSPIRRSHSEYEPSHERQHHQVKRRRTMQVVPQCRVYYAPTPQRPIYAHMQQQENNHVYSYEQHHPPMVRMQHPYPFPHHPPMPPPTEIA